MSKLTSLFFAIALLLIPTLSFADVSIVDHIEDELNSIDQFAILDNHIFISRQAPDANKPSRPSDNDEFTDEDESSINAVRPNRPNQNVKPNTHKDAHQQSHFTRPSNQTNTHYTNSSHKNPPPTNQYRPSPPPPPRRPAEHVYHPRTEVLVVEQSTYYAPTSYVEYNSTSSTTASSVTTKDYLGSHFGFGLRIIGSKVTDYVFSNGELEPIGTSPGFGWYIKFRPIRWVSLELLNDFIFTETDFGDTYTRIPLYFGLHTHLFDYGQLDLYAITDIGVSFMQLYEHNYHSDTIYMQWGGQFGLGISVIFNVLEFGLDIRYTLESAPADHYCYHDYHEYDKSEIVHGVIFGLNIGFGI